MQTDEKKRTLIPFARRDWLLLLVTAICALIFAFCQPCIFEQNARLPGIGMTLTTLILLAAGMYFIGIKRIRRSAQWAFLTVSTVLLALCFGIFDNELLRLMNLPVLLALCLLSLLSAAHGPDFLTNTRSLSRIATYFKQALKRISLPCHATAEVLKKRMNSRTPAVLLGLAITIPVLGVVLLLLYSADSVFAAMLKGLFSQPDNADIVMLIWRLVKMLVLMLLTFALLHALITPIVQSTNSAARHTLPTSVMVMPLATLSVLLAIFDYIQCKYLFGGAYAAVIQGNYAQYARSGFFQLVIAAAISMSVALPALCRYPNNAAIRVLSTLLALLTALLTVSAARRMQLYILEYGFTTLRAVTLWGMLAILLLIAAALIKAIRPRAHIRSALCAAIIATWLLLNYSNVDARISQYNLNAWQRGALNELDTDIICYELSPDALPYLRRLAGENTSVLETLEQIEDSFRQNQPTWYDWSLSWTKLS